ncbi:MAG: hypothetical protein KAW09_07315, partial [Thermoplasmata archaeon]|nr:hypothetical protein [Thermoplasmata archaeon]
MSIFELEKRYDEEGTGNHDVQVQWNGGRGYGVKGDVDELKEPFRIFIDRYRERMRVDARAFLRSKRALENNPDSTLAMTSIVAVVLTKGWWRPRLLENFRRITGKDYWSVEYLRSP